MLGESPRLVAVAYLLIVLLMTFLERYLVYPGPPIDRSDWAAGESFEDVFFESEDGTRLNGWFYEHPAPTRVVLYFHGNGEQVPTTPT